jgi:rRNA maturation RNase YbeY
MSRGSVSVGRASGKGRDWQVGLLVESRKLGLSAANIRKMVKAVLSELESDVPRNEVSELSVLITDDRRIRVLNREFRGKDKATDVLSFPQFTRRELHSKRSALIGSNLGDLVISSETTLEQAKRFGVTKHQELLRLVVHGVLHLCGYDHEGVSPAEAQRMRRRERATLKKLSLQK